MTVGLPVKRLINVSVILNPPNAEFENLNLPMFFGDSDIIDVKQRYRAYTDIQEVAADFGTSAPEYLAAVDFFTQVPTPQNLLIARWAKTATHGLLECGFLTATQQTITNWNVINNAEFHIAIDGAGPVNIGPLDFTAQVNLNGVAAVISGALAGATCTWNGNQFVFRSNTAGPPSAIAPLTAGGGGTDIHNQLAGTLALGAIEVDGIAAESALAAVELLDGMPVDFYGIYFAVVQTDISNSDHEAIANWVENLSINNHLYGITSQDPNAINGASTSDIGYLLLHANATQGYTRTFTQYSSTDPYAAASIFGRMATVDFTQPNSTISLMYKQEPGVTPELLTETQADVLDRKQYNYFAQYNAGVAILESGITASASGIFIDEIWGADWLANDIQVNIFNLLLTVPKVPQTDDGMHLITTTVSESMDQANSNGLVGPGVWEQQGFGQLTTGMYLEKGYYVFVPPISQQSLPDRKKRKSPIIQVAAIFAGAVNTVAVQVNVMR